ncbi:hypothetical protein Tco_1337703 [Tanacetum coccineum]
MVTTSLKDSHKTQDSNKHVLPSTGMKSSTSASRSQPSGNTNTNRISQTTNSNPKNKVEDQPRSVKYSSNKKNRVIKPICDVNVKHTKLNENSKVMFVKCSKCMFDANHDMCFLEFVNDVNVLSKSTSVKKSKNKNIWKPTGKVFTDISYRWKPTRWTFIIARNTCPLTRITSTKVVPLKETTSKSVITQNPEVNVNSRRPKVIKSVDVPSSYLVDFRLSKLFSGIWTSDAPRIWHETALSLSTLFTNFWVLSDSEMIRLQR